jgi:hypothetical protein
MGPNWLRSGELTAVSRRACWVAGDGSFPVVMVREADALAEGAGPARAADPGRVFRLRVVRWWCRGLAWME